MHGVDVVVHAAALKQVPACEYNPFEAVKTNVLGAKNVIDAAIDQGVKRVIGAQHGQGGQPDQSLRRDQALRREALRPGQRLRPPAGHRASPCVRYGNVIGSRGSVIPLFAAQRASGRVTVTDRA